jgi:predicted DNA binding CopG/RHH family protein
MKKKFKIPKFRNEDQERAFWSKLDLPKHFEPSDFKKVSFPNLKPSSQPISLRLPSHLLARVKEHANEIDMPYQSLIKQYIAQGILEEE